MKIKDIKERYEDGDSHPDDIRDLLLENEKLLEAIENFCKEANWASKAWKEQPHVAKLFQIIENKD